jgi:hypothetical protein
MILSSKAKQGGNPIDNTITTMFRSTLTLCGLQDLGFEGDIFTWTNRNQGDQFIKARLDRFLANNEWITCFPKYSNHHLLRYKSDHSPIMLDFAAYATASLTRNPRPVRYEQVWTRDNQHTQIVKNYWNQARGPLHHKLHITLKNLHSWGKKIFGNIPKNIKIIQEDLNSLNSQHGADTVAAQIRSKEKRLDELLEEEELWWQQRSRALWLQHGDKNTSYFHIKANFRKKRNRIDSITDSQGTIQYEAKKIEQVFLDHFQNIFNSQNTYNIP